MKLALVILCVGTLLVYYWWEFLCAVAVGGVIQTICDFGFTP